MRGLCVVILRIENPCVGGSIPPQATKFKSQPRERLAFFMRIHVAAMSFKVSNVLQILKKPLHS